MPAAGASLATSKLLRKGREGMQAKLGVTGLTGPGEHWFNTSVSLNSSSTVLAGEDTTGRLNVRNSYSDAEGEVVDEEEEELRRAKRFMPSVFSELKEAEDGEETEGEDPLDEDYNSDDDQDPEFRARKAKFGWDINNYTNPAELDTSASAAEIVQAWAFRLKGKNKNDIAVFPCNQRGLINQNFLQKFTISATLPTRWIMRTTTTS